MIILSTLKHRALGAVARLTSSALGQNAIWMLAGLGLRLLIQASYFVVIARSLGPAEYGEFVAAVALVSVIAPFVSLGSGSLLVRAVAQDRGVFSEAFGTGLSMTMVTGLPMVIGVLGICTVFFPGSISFFPIACIALADLVFVKVLDMAAWAFQAHERLGRYAQLTMLISLSRLIGVTGLRIIAKHSGIDAWSAVYLGAAAASAVIAVATAIISLGKPTFTSSQLWKQAWEGFHFSVSTSAQTIYNDIDKAMVARLSTLEATGIYGAAYRLIDVAFIPVRALLNAAYPGFFRSGAQGIRASLSYGRRLQLWMLPYSLLAVASLFFGSPLASKILGPGYANVTEAIRWLAPIPLLKTLQFFVADSLTGAGYQSLRTLAQVGVAIFNVLLNLWIIPAYGWRGAAWSSIASDGLLVLALWGIASVLLLYEKPYRQLHASKEMV